MADIRYQLESLKPMAEIVYPSGTTINQLIDDLKIPDNVRDYLMVFRDGAVVKDYDLIIEEHEKLTVAVVPRGGGGGKNGTLGIVASIAIAYAAPYAAPYVAANTGISVTLATAAISIVGTLLVSSLIPPPASANSGSQSFEEPLTYNLTGQTNSANVYGGVPAIYGQTRFYPYIAAQTKVVQLGKKSILNALYDFGLGNLLITDVKIGSQPAQNLGARFNFFSDTKSPNLKFLTATSGYDQLAYNMSANSLTVTTKPNADAVAITMVLPRGLARFNDQGNPTNYEIALKVEVRQKGTTAWRVAGSRDFKVEGITVRDDREDKRVANYNEPVQVSGAKTYRYGSGTNELVQVQSENFVCVPDFFKESKRDLKPVIDDDKLRYPNLFQQVTPYNNNPYWSYGQWIDPRDPYEKVAHGLPCYQVDAVLSKVIFTGATAQPNSIRFETSFNVQGTYEIRITRSSAESTNTRILDQLQVTSVETLKNEKPVQLDHPHTLIEMQVQSSERLTGNVDNLSAFVSRRIRTIDQNGFLPNIIETSNPALIALDILTNEANREPLRDDQIDFASFYRLAEFCNEEVTYQQGGKTLTHKKYEFNGVVVGASVQEAVNNVLSNGRAQLLMLQNGKFGVLIDQPKSVPKQLITPANSWNFKGSRVFPYYPDAMRVEYVEPELNWAKSEVVVYSSNSINASNAKRYETLKTTGIINYDQAYRYARFMMNQAKFRSEVFSVSMDIENLAVVRGDLVLVQHDVPKMGAPALRVVSNEGAIVTFNQSIEIPANASYTVRTLDGEIKNGTIKQQIDDVTIELDVADPDITPDALLTIGETNKVTHPYLVLTVTPQPDLTATLELSPYNENVYSDEILPEWNPSFSGSLINGTSLKVTNLTAVQELTYVNRQPQVDIGLRWDIEGTIGLLERVDVYYIVEGQEGEYCGSSDGKELIWKMSPIRQKELTNRNEGYFVATPFSKLNFEGESTELTYMIQGDITPPLPVDGFGVNILNNSLIDIFWKKSRDVDIDKYELRYTPELKNPSWNISSHLSTVDHTTTRTSAGARTGSYGLMVIDTTGNKSDPQWLRTSVENLPSLDFIVELNDAPLWNGNKINCNTDSGTLQLNGEFGSVTDQIGYYEFEEVYDANEIQELRCISYLEGYGVSAKDFMSDWIPLASADPLASATEEDFDYWLEISTSETQTVMADWIPLASADPIAGGGVGWQPWRRVESADLTGQLYRFRIAMVSYNADVNVLMKSGRTEIDVLDRFESYPDINVTTGGVRIDFNPPFRSTPAVAVTIDGNTENVRYEIQDKNKNNATIALINNETGVNATGKIDVQVQGYGKIRSAPL